MKISINKLSLITIICVFFIACTHYDSNYEPKFKVSEETIKLNINKIIAVEEIHIEGNKIRVADSLNILLNVQLVNPKKLNKNKDYVKFIQKKVANKIKNLLRDPYQFKQYDMIFIQRDTVKGIVGKITTEKALNKNSFRLSNL
jgi:hypothetical protein